MASAYGDTPQGLFAQILNFAAILTRRLVLEVPRYQRPYSWNEQQVRQLIQDLWRAFSRGAKFYFIGQIVLVKSKDGRLEISDGQQRLATLTMIIAYVRDRLPNRTKHYQGLIMSGDQPRLRLRKNDSGFFRGYVQEVGNMAALAALDDTGIDSRNLMCAAARTIADELGETGDRELDAFMSFIARSATFNVVEADERGCAATVYHTLNDRGLELNAADNLKCDLLENSGLRPEDADAAASKWEELEDLLGRKRFGVLLNWTPFLLTGASLVSPDDLVEIRGAVDKMGGVRNFLFDHLQRYAEALSDIFNEDVNCGSATDNADINRRLKMMKQVNRDWSRWLWLPPAIAFLAQPSGKPERARRFFQALDRLTWACAYHEVDNRRQDIRFARAMRGVGDDKALYGPKGALELTPKEHMSFVARLNGPHGYGESRRLLMLRLEAAMDGGSVLDIDADAGVEHVLPKKGGLWWNERIPSVQLRKEYVNLLGNLVLVKHEQNQRAGNKDFPFKRDVFFNTKGAPVHAVTQDIAGIQEWTLDVIEARQERLVRILCDDWDLMRGGAAQAA